MKEVVKFIILQLYNYAGRNIIIILFCLSLMYIILLDKHKRKSIAIPTIILLFLILNPILYLSV